MMRKVIWDVDENGPLSEDSVRALYQPPGHYRVSRRRFPSGTQFPGTMRAGRCYVMKGQCRYKFSGVLDLRAGEVADLPAGDFDFQVLGPEDAEIIMVWELPAEFRSG